MGMQAQVNQIITSASGFLPSLLLLAVLAVVVVVSLAAGLGSRLAICVEDLCYRRRLVRARSRTA
jgi:hypothetical protein